MPAYLYSVRFLFKFLLWIQFCTHGFCLNFFFGGGGSSRYTRVNTVNKMPTKRPLMVEEAYGKGICSSLECLDGTKSSKIKETISMTNNALDVNTVRQLQILSLICKYFCIWLAHDPRKTELNLIFSIVTFPDIIWYPFIKPLPNNTQWHSKVWYHS